MTLFSGSEFDFFIFIRGAVQQVKAIECKVFEFINYPGACGRVARIEIAASLCSSQ